VTRVAVVGGGAAGALQALHLRQAGVADVTLIERAHAPGRGVAYSTRRPEHLLNVPARRMSALADDPDHFTRWFAARAGGGDEDFAPRMLYGDYLAELLAAAAIETVRGEAVDLAGDVVLADGGRIAADAVVLAPGNLKPATPGGIDPDALGPLWVGDPWAEGIADGLGSGDIVLLLGTGLTAVDAALTLEAAGFPGRIVALSRRGLAPRAHGPREPMVAPCEELPPSCTAMLRRVRARGEEVGWRSAVHELRSVTQALWGAAGMGERRRFLRHLRPWWDVHRHKVAPAVGETIEEMQSAAKLAVAAGKLVSAEADGDRAVVRFRARGGEAVETLRVARIVNCTGPEMNIVRSGEPLLYALVAAGRIRPDPLRIGIDVDQDCRALDADGAPSDTLYAIGPMTRGAFWESVAVPDIRGQAARVAARIAAT
jgi:uncharacterized NAD(P)/FAD-binding protein YdhS